MKGLPEERAITLGNYIIEHDATVRQAAKEFNIRGRGTVFSRLFCIPAAIFSQIVIDICQK